MALLRPHAGRKAPPKGRASRRALPLLLLLSGLLFLQGAAIGGDEVPKEYQIKAAFLYNFLKFVEWPPAGLPAGSDPIVIGAFCNGRFGAVLEKIVRDRTVQGRAIAVRTLRVPAEAASVHLAYVCAEYDPQWRPMREALAGRPVLTVADTERDGAAGAMIVFVLDGDKVRFRIDMHEVRHAGLNLSDQLQKLAITVRRAP